MTKKILFLMFALVAIATTAGAQGGVAINSTNFPGTNFRKFVKDNYDKDGDNFLSDAEIAAVTKINVYGKSIGDLKGIERFTALKELDCRKNGLLELDLSKNTALTELICSANNLGSLDLSKNTALVRLECSENKLTRLNVSENTALTELWCDINQIKAPAMRKLLESLPEVSRGTLGVIDTKSSNEQNVITSPQVAIAKDKGWSVLDLNGGSSYIPYAGSDPGLEINATNFPDPNFRSYVLDFIDEDEDGYLSDEERSLRGLNLGFTEGNIASLKGIELFTELEELYCWDNQLTSLDLSQNTKLVELNCSFNQLTSLDLSKNTNLRVLFCHGNQLTSLDLSQNTKLYQLECGNNQLTSLDLSHNTKLFQLGCGNNQLTSLDVSKNTALRVLFCHGNQIKGDKMQALVNSLPTASGVDGKFYVIDSKDSNEGNVITKSQVAIAKGKSWKVYDYNTVDGGGHRPVEYDGVDPGSAPIPYELKLEPGLTIMTVSSTMDFAALWMAAMADVFNVESSKETGAVFNSKKTGKTLIIAGEGIVWVSADVTPEDNVTFDIPAAGRAELIKEFGEDLLSDYGEVTLSFVALPEKKDLTLSFPKKENTLEELNISEGSMEGIALYALLYWEKLQSFEDEETDATVFANMSGKNLFEMIDDKIIVCDGVTSADNIVYTITDKNREDFMKGMEMPFDIFTAYKTIQIKFEFGTMGIGGVEADGLDKAAWYTLDGKKLSGEPTRKGVYIYKGRKVVK